MEQVSLVDEDKIDTMVRGLYETAVIDALYRLPDLMKAYKRYMSAHTYNHLKGEKAILKDIIEESESKQDLAYYMEKYKPSINKEFERLAKKTVEECGRIVFLFEQVDDINEEPKPQALFDTYYSKEERKWCLEISGLETEVKEFFKKEKDALEAMKKYDKYGGLIK